MSRRLKKKLEQFTETRERKFYNYIYSLKRKNKKLLNQHLEQLSEKEEDSNDEQEDTNIQEIYTREEYIEGYKYAAWAFTRMVCLIWFSLFIGDLYDKYNK
jgi:gas vesicle protein